MLMRVGRTLISVSRVPNSPFSLQPRSDVHRGASRIPILLREEFPKFIRNNTPPSRSGKFRRSFEGAISAPFAPRNIENV
jgi:hypothetical protein